MLRAFALGKNLLDVFGYHWACWQILSAKCPPVSNNEKMLGFCM